MNLDALLDREFPDRRNLDVGKRRIVHMNHAGVAPWPMRAVQAARQFAEDNAAAGAMHYPAWDALVGEVRQRLAELLNATPGEIALTKNTSEGLSLVAAGVDWRPGDNVVVGAQEFPSNRLVWESLKKRFGVDVRLADLQASSSPEDALIASMDADTRLLAVSSIQFSDGRRMDLVALGEACRKRKALFCIDAIQSLGAAPFDARAVGADFVCADGHKWLLAPEGTGVLFCRQDLLSTLKLSQYGWRMNADPYDYEASQSQHATDAQRLECGSLNHLGLHAMHASLGLLLEVGLELVHRGVQSKIDYLLEHADPALFESVTPVDPEKRGGIVTLRPLKVEPVSVFAHLKQQRVFCAMRAGGVRLSPHFYTTREHLDYALEHMHAAAT